jgi:hypothetical protein
MAATGLFVVFTLFSAQLFSMITFTGGGGFTQLVDGDNSYYYYLMQQASAQEEEEVINEDANGEVNQSSTEESLPPSSSPPSTGATSFVPSSQEQEAVQEEQQQAQQQPPTPTNQTTPTADASAQDVQTVLICGWVFNDINQNRKRDAGELGIEGATVTLEPASRGASIASGSFKTGMYGNYCVSGGRTHIEDMPASFFVMVTPPQMQSIPFTPGEVQKPVVFTATTELVVTVSFNESDVLSKEVNFGFRQVEVALPEV